MSPGQRRLTLATAVAVVAGAAVLLAGAPPQALDTADAADARAANAAPLGAPIPTDAAVRIGTLPNGLRYYVRSNTRPAARAELRLVVRAGSILEDDDQRGLAHVVEHLAFDGTTHFPGASLRQFLSTIGTNLGADLNAGTSFDETVYKMQVPTTTPALIDRCLLVLEDWAHGLAFDPTAIGRARAAVIEEWRGRLGAADRLSIKQTDIFFNGSRYRDRKPIGTERSREDFTVAQLVRFYRDWYRPDLMAVIAVGDFDAAAVEGLIQTRFTPITGPAAPRPRATYDVPDHAGTVYGVASDPEAPATTVVVSRLLPRRDVATVNAFRDQMADAAASGMLTMRLADLARGADAPFVAGAARRTVAATRTKDQTLLTAVTRDGAGERALDALLTEAGRAAQYGFTASEFDEQRAALARSIERAFAERDSANRADEYVRNFIDREPIPSTVYEITLRRRLLASLTVADVSNASKDWFIDQNRFVVVTAPEKPGTPPPTEARLAAISAAAATKILSAPVETARVTSLMETRPAPGTVVSTRAIDPPGLTEWTLSNGMRVVLKPTAAKASEVVFEASSPGGLSLADDDDWPSALTSPLAASATGLGSLTAPELQRVLALHPATATPVLTELHTVLRGAGTTPDLETLFQLIHLRFAEPPDAPDLFEAHKAQMRVLLGNGSSPDAAFAEALGRALTQRHPRGRGLTAADLDQSRLEVARSFYRDRFADASNFTFVFVGSFDLGLMRPLVERYLASLPSTFRHETWTDRGIRLPAGIVSETIRRGTEPKARVAMVFNGPFDYDPAPRAALMAMAAALQSRLFGAIRGQLGGTYNITAVPAVQKLPVPTYRVVIQWDCDPARVDELASQVLDEAKFLTTTAPSAAFINALHVSATGRFEDLTAQQNAAMLQQLSLAYMNSDEPDDAWRVAAELAKVDAKAMLDAARRYLDTTRYVKIVMLPAS